MEFMTYVVFGIAALIILGSAVMMVTRRNLVHAALFLMLAFLGVAMVFVMLEAYYWAVIQVVVYIGAIAILVIMTVMVTRDVTGKESEPFNKNMGWAGVLAAAVVAVLVMAFWFWPEFGRTAPEAMIGQDAIVELGVQFVSAEGYVLPTMTASLLLLGAFFGALRLAFTGEQKEEK